MTYRAVLEETLVNSYIIWSDARIKLGFLDGIKALTSNRSVTWDPSKTTIEAVHLTVSATSRTTIGSTQMILYMNNREVARKFWNLGGPYTGRFDVTTILNNGPNTFVAEYEKNPVINPSAELTLTVILEIMSAGDEIPDVPDPPPPWLPDWWPYAALGVGMAAVGGIVLYFKRKK